MKLKLNLENDLSLLATVLSGGAAATYTISGTVYDADGTTPVQSATVALGAYNATTAANGTYTISNVPAGTSGSMTCTKSGYLWTAITVAAMSGNLESQNFVGLRLIVFDQFITPASAPLDSPRTCEPGPGTLTIVDTSNKLSIAANELVIVSGASRADMTHDLGSSKTNPMGLVFDVRSPSPYLFAFLNNTGLYYEMLVGRDAYLYINNPQTSNVKPYAFSTALGSFVRIGMIRYPTYTFYIFKDGGLNDGNPFSIGYAFNTTSTSYRYFSITSYIAGATGYVDNVRLFDVPVADTYYELAQTNIADAETFTNTTANFSMCWRYIAQNGVTQNIMFRRSDDDNTLFIRCNQSTNKITLYKKVSGVETALTGDVNFTQVAGISYQMSLSCMGNLLTAQAAGAGNCQATDSTNASIKGIKFSHVAADLKVFKNYLPTSAINALA